MKQAGHINSDGYTIITINGTECFAHDLAWMYMTAEVPEVSSSTSTGFRDDDRWCNLRLKAATYSNH
jgi:hypothetical protein